MESALGVRDVSRPGRKGRSGSLKVVLLVILFAILAGALWTLPVKQYLVAILEWTENLGSGGPIFVVAFYVLACVFLLPGSIITLGAGFLFGIWIGTITVWIGANLGAVTAFLVGRTVARSWVERKVAENPKFAAIDEAVGKEGFKIILLLRLSPVVPFNLLNYALGLTRVSLSSYALATMIGMIPGALMYVYLGSAARSLAAAAAGQVEGGVAGQLFFWIGLVATAVVALFVTRLASRSLKSAEMTMRFAETPIRYHGSPPRQEKPQVVPEDEHNRRLVSNVHPQDWVNPEPKERYNLVVIGAGTAGLVTAAGAAGLGARVALVERHLLGGDCLNVGCVPSKSVIRSSRVIREIDDARGYGIRVPNGVEADFGAVMERMRRLRAGISRHDSVQRFTDLGVDVFLGHARFSGPETVEVDGRALRFKKAVIATGARAVLPEIKGLGEAAVLTNETVFSLTERPARFAVIGGGPIGCEMAQAFQRLGSQVILFHKNEHLLDREDSDAAEIIQKAFMQEGIRLLLNSTLVEFEVRNGEKIIHFEKDGAKDSVAVDEILVAVGRATNVEDMGLETAGVRYNVHKGVHVNDYLQTTNPRIFAAGDVSMNHKFTHAADAAARIVIQNALFRPSKRLSALTVPWCTYTDPEIAHVGMYERDAAQQGLKIDTYLIPFQELDRAVMDGQEHGFVKIHVHKGKDKIVGGTIVASHAGDMISEITLAMVSGVGLGAISGVIHPYPTQAEAIKKAGDQYNRTRLTPFVKRALLRWFAWAR